MSFHVSSWLVILAAASAASGERAWQDCNQKADIMLGIAACTSIINRNDEASSALSKAYNNRGVFFGVQEQFDRAIADFEKAIELDPENPTPYYNQGLTYNDTGDTDRALSDLDHLITMKPSEIADAYQLRGSILFNRHEYARALRNFDEVIDLAPRNAFTLCQRGLTLGFLQRYEDATRDFNASISLDPTNKCLLAIQDIGKNVEEEEESRKPRRYAPPLLNR
jgi:tetratricopeptide (TPR) repeat protein